MYKYTNQSRNHNNLIVTFAAQSEQENQSRKTTTIKAFTMSFLRLDDKIYNW